MDQCGEKYRCPVAYTLEMIGGKYKALILWNMRDKTLRYSELARIVSSATAKMLTQHLRELERDGLLKRRVYPVIPPKVEYSLTEFGCSIIPVLSAMCNWGAEHMEKSEIGKL